MKISICLFILLLAAGEVILDMEISVLTHFVVNLAKTTHAILFICSLKGEELNKNLMDFS